MNKDILKLFILTWQRDYDIDATNIVHDQSVVLEVHTQLYVTFHNYFFV
jgi:hypothetical protein